MSGLNDLNESTPEGVALVAFGDNEIRAVKAKIKEFANVEHDYNGAHKIPKGSTAERPSGVAGRLYILQTGGREDEIQYYDEESVSWKKVTKNQEIVDYADDLLTHQTAALIDHPDNSITTAKIKKKNIVKKHLDDSDDMTTLENLVNGSNADTFHVHDSDGIANGAITTNKISADSVTGNKLSKDVASDGVQVVAISAEWIPSEGVYGMVDLNGKMQLVLKVGGTWRAGTAIGSLFMYFDGVNMKITNDGSGSCDIYYQKF